MKKIIAILGMFSLLFSISFFQSCTGCNRPNPNYEGVLMTNCGSNGINDFKTVTGSQGVLGPCSTLYQVPMFEQTGEAIKDKIVSKEGGVFDIEPLYTYSAIRGKGPQIVHSYKHTSSQDVMDMDAIEDKTLDPALLNIYREVAREYSTDSLLNNVNQYEKEVEQLAATEFRTRFFDLKNLTSNLKPPTKLVDAIESRDADRQKISAMQNEIELSKLRLEKERLETQINQEKARGLSKELIQMEYIEAIKNADQVIITAEPIKININQ